ncbi:NAD(P)/FAD-dependent oxidoreductase [Limnohabitans sp. JirII-31]|uniref:NAD(P)/FAD-dependent oxidoreductase n=1 Tax=Limnohabitans sp. JirII-31 TaxID=1977908 RepID=UPI000C1E550A|nr:FAD-dependent oxidoreductase [Limnohabitans sp. JirII-31]PIT79742.1 FAD-dependent oxidoreductase [Limnohabitans sp. JirII-31]
MIRLSELKLPLSDLPLPERRAADAPAETEADRHAVPHPVDTLRQMAAQALGLAPSAIATLDVFKRSFDARKKLLVVYIVDVTLTDPAQEAALLAQHAQHPHIHPTPAMTWQPPAHAPGDWGHTEGERPVVVGFGPCGMFAALVLAQMGFKPIVIERGTTVRQRTKDTWGLWRKHVLKAESNVQFGEGGAGTFSDGKLYSQIKDPRHLGRKVMQELVRFGAPEEILWAAHPHVGTFKLVKVVEGLREEIIRLGGEVRFEQRVVDLLYEDAPSAPHMATATRQRQVRGLRVFDLASGETHTLNAHHLVIALGHSARDTFTMLHRHAVSMEAKPFSVGVRIEHPQSVIDRARWGQHAGHPLLGAADYKLVHHAANGRAVYSFCMCPGGTVVAATSEPHRVVTNGMSQYSRNERNANAGIVVGIDPRDYPTDPAAFEAALGEDMGHNIPHSVRHDTRDAPGGFHPLAGMVLQRQLESHAYTLGGGTYEAPAQLVGDFVAGRASTALGTVEPSYKPGVKMVSLDSALPSYAIAAMREALPVFGQKIKGFDMRDAVMTGVETRTSSPLRMARDDHSLQSPNMAGLYPAGEGAGYAGGILSAAVDGIKVGEALARQLMTLH